MPLFKYNSPDDREKEWAFAREYFTENPEKVKLKRPKIINLAVSPLQHSFINLNGKLYSMAVHDYFGEGAYGKVKAVETEDGKVFALKIEGAIEKNRQNELDALRLVGELEAHGVRNLEAPQDWIGGKQITKKVLTIMNVAEGKNLLNQIYLRQQMGAIQQGPVIDPGIPMTYRMLISAQAIKLVNDVHDKGIIHADLKPDNFMMNIDGKKILLKLVDYGFSQVTVNKPLHIHIPTSYGTDTYMAPEIQNGIYSAQSDAYAMGVILNQMQISHPVINTLKNKNPDDRASLELVLETLYRMLQNNPDLENYRGDDIAEYLIEHKFSDNDDINYYNALIKAVDISTLSEAEKNTIVKWALKGNIEINAKDPNGNSILMIAAELGNSNNVTKLLDMGAQFHAQNASKINAYDFAKKANQNPIILIFDKLIVKQKLEIEQERIKLDLAKTKQDDDRVAKSSRDFLMRTFKNKKVNYFNEGIEDWETPILLSLLKYKVPMFIWKSAFDAAKPINLNAVDDNGKSALMYAVEQGNIEAITLLLDKGADPELVNQLDNNKKAINYAETIEVIELLRNRKPQGEPLILSRTKSDVASEKGAHEPQSPRKKPNPQEF